MPEFADSMYGSIVLPQWLEPFLKLPEFVRLRGVRLSNLDSYQFKDFASATRWEHGVAVAYLALRCAEERGLDERRSAELVLAGLLHDIATPPFAHTAEYVLQGFDHESETQRLLMAMADGSGDQSAPIFAGQLPQFENELRKLSGRLGVKLDPAEVARMVVGDGELGFLICGTVDLDNADNVVRACRSLGIEVDARVPLGLAGWLARQERAPTDLSESDEPAVRKWLHYRERLYSSFYHASDAELGRQAFLQHLLRRAFGEGFSRSELLSSTDESLLYWLEGRGETAERLTSCRQLVWRYRLLEEPARVAYIQLQGAEEIRAFGSPQFAAWVEQEFAKDGSEIMVTSVVDRFGDSSDVGGLLREPRGAVQLYRLGSTPVRLPHWLPAQLGSGLSDVPATADLTKALGSAKKALLSKRPWLELSVERRGDVVDALDAVGDWSFQLSRNESMHPYPSTFVHAIPANLIRCLGIAGELVLDPFGGTGQTSMEAVKAGSRAVSSDTNSIASLAARAKLTFLEKSIRDKLRHLSEEVIVGVEPCTPPEMPGLERWFGDVTLEKLCRIWTFVEEHRGSKEFDFLVTCFSAVLTLGTGRRGKQHGFFADNTPLEKGLERPPDQPVIEDFLARVAKNLAIVERSYAFFERAGRDPSQALGRAKVLQVDAQNASAELYGVEPETVAAVVTSPPYLCMSDYSLGQRLSYAWIAPERLGEEFNLEIGSRRERSSPNRALVKYQEDLVKFVRGMSGLVRPGGFLAVVMGEPLAKAFREVEILSGFDDACREDGFDPLWQVWREIHWHRNWGYQRLKKERIAVYSKR